MAYALVEIASILSIIDENWANAVRPYKMIQMVN